MKNNTKQKRKDAQAFSVSRKFYDEIMGRIESSFTSIIFGSSLLGEVKRYVHKYLSDGREPQTPLGEGIQQVAVLLLKPEIEKAMARSARARARGRRRRGEDAQAVKTGIGGMPAVTIRRAPKPSAYGVPRLPSCRTTVIDFGSSETHPQSIIDTTPAMCYMHPGYEPSETSAFLTPQFDRQWWDTDGDIFLDLPDAPEDLPDAPENLPSDSGTVSDDPESGFSAKLLGSPESDFSSVFVDTAEAGFDDKCTAESELLTVSDDIAESAPHDASNDASNEASHDTPHDALNGASAGQPASRVPTCRRRRFLKQARRLARKSRPQIR